MAFLLLAAVACRSGAGDEAQQGNPGDTSHNGAGMEMPREADHEGHRQMPGKQQPSDSTDEAFWSTLPANQTVISRQAVVQAGDSSMQYSFSGNGYVDFDQRRSRKIAVRVGGRIEKLYTKYNYQYVRKGEKLMELYSPELNTFVEEFLFVSRQSKDPVLLDKARQKLRLLGLTEAQINQFTRSGRAPFTISVYSPYEGYVLFSPSGSGGGMGTGAGTESGSMGGMAAAGRSTSISGSVLPDNSIREGMYVSKDQTVFWVNDFLEAWGVVAFTSEAGAVLEPGRETVVTSELFPERPLRAVIGMVEPVYSSGQKFTQVRLYLPNPNRQLKQNSLLTAKAYAQRTSPVVPASSVYYVGRTAIVWVRTGVTESGSSIFQARAVRVGHRDKEMVEITKGLKANDWIARDAAYLVDSETIIQYLSQVK
ncbi:hypothetical protein GCM10023188_15230 [Pontibacter saemangeumensis]|uniref:Membrane fusion protein, Cu(I)/Ag(I) efflux system n=2 Tax=Pontibacter saemangeumensis TaxID=1084525 RepID=A0ABP8LH47_9BACT